MADAGAIRPDYNAWTIEKLEERNSDYHSREYRGETLTEAQKQDWAEVEAALDRKYDAIDAHYDEDSSSQDDLGDDWDHDYLHGAANDYSDIPNDARDRDVETQADRDRWAADKDRKVWYADHRHIGDGLDDLRDYITSLTDEDINQKLAAYEQSEREGSMDEDSELVATGLYGELSRRQRHHLEATEVVTVELVDDDLPF